MRMISAFKQDASLDVFLCAKQGSWRSANAAQKLLCATKHQISALVLETTFSSVISSALVIIIQPTASVELSP